MRKKLRSEGKNIMKPLSEEVLRDKIRGCYLGKNVGGTLGAPFEGEKEMNDVGFYTQKLDGNPLPNDDLDLQLLWLVMAEYYGLEHLTSRHFGEYWLNAVTGPWGEYAHCRWNCLEGFFPPLSGSCENDFFRYSNGAWIRSEIWACLCAGRPDDAIRFAWLDSSCDHSGDGIYAEMFTAALEAAAFYCSDLQELLKIALSKIPAGRLRESIELTIAGHAAGKDWKTVRNEIVAHNTDIGMFQAAVDVPFTVLALLYGEGDFGKTVCLAVNCGDDTDCTAATAGSVLGIIQGAKALPEKWIDPIGDGIATISLNRFGMPLPIPKTVTELTLRIQRLRKIAELYDPRSVLPVEDFFAPEIAQELWQRSPYELLFDLLFTTVSVDFPDGPYAEPGKPVKLKIGIRDGILEPGVVRMRWLLPEGWTCAAPELSFGARIYYRIELETTVTPPETTLPAMSYLHLKVTTAERGCPSVITVPVRSRTAVSFPAPDADPARIGWSHKQGILRSFNVIQKQQL